MYIDTLKYDVASCPNCGYTAMNRYFEHLSSVQIKLIKEKICANFKPTGEEPRYMIMIRQLTVTNSHCLILW